jgi:hypothetical protein
MLSNLLYPEVTFNFSNGVWGGRFFLRGIGVGIYYLVICDLLVVGGNYKGVFQHPDRALSFSLLDHALRHQVSNFTEIRDADLSKVYFRSL